MSPLKHTWTGQEYNELINNGWRMKEIDEVWLEVKA
jgi:hypothetical protein